MMTTEDKKKIETARNFYDTELDVIADDIVWHVPGRNPVSGDYVGRQQYTEAMPARMAPLDRWDFKIHDIMVNREFVVVIFKVEGERKGKRVQSNGAHLLRLNLAGKIVEGLSSIKTP